MSRRRKTAHHSRPAAARAVTADPRQDGLRAFQAGRFDMAIAAWSALAGADTAVAAALAEAYFRRALARAEGEEQRADLRQALELVPQEPRYRYRLGLALHRAGDLGGASEQYRAVLARDETWPGAGMVLALAVLEQNSRAEIAALPGHTPAVRVALGPVQALLRGQLPELGGGQSAVGVPSPTAGAGAPWESKGPVNRLWYGLGLIQAGDGAAARAALDDTRPLPTAAATSIRRYYWGVAAALSGDMQAAQTAWSQAVDRGLTRPWLSANLALALLDTQLASLAVDGTAGAGGTAGLTQRAVALASSNPTVAEALVRRLDEAAHTAVAAGDWAEATQLWERARQVVAGGSGLGSPRPLLHNLALAYEAQERWSEAAEAWRAMLRTRPRRARQDGDLAPRPQEGGLTDAQWAWVRKRVIACYKDAGTPGEAVAIFRQAIKADPDDVETRLQLVDALLANEQDEAAFNELGRILGIDPHHVEARLRLATLEGDNGNWRVALSMLRALVAEQPQREDLGRALAQLLLRYGEEREQFGYHAEATALFQEGQTLAPDDYQFPLRLARQAIGRRNPAEAQRLLERTLEVGADQPNAYVAVIDCWAVADDLAAARAVLARAEAALTLSARFYVSLGTTLLLSSEPGRATLRSAGGAKGRRRAGASEDAWMELAKEMLERACVLAPGDAEVPAQIATVLITRQPELALTYAEEAARLQPEDVRTLVVVGLVLGVNRRISEAQSILRRAARLARQQGKPDQARHAEELAQQVTSPLLRLTLEMAEMYDQAGINPEDLF